MSATGGQLEGPLMLSEPAVNNMHLLACWIIKTPKNM